MLDHTGRVLVAGATGYLGRHLVEALDAARRPVRALVRRPDQAESFPSGVEVVVGQVTQPDSLAGAMDDVAVVFSTVGITRQRDGLRYRDVDYAANLNLLRLAERSDVARFGYVSVLHGRELRSTVRLVAAKEQFVDALTASPLSSLVVRPTGYFSDMAAFADMARRGTGFVVGDGRQQMNPISGRDLARACIAALDTDVSEVEVGGPDVLTHEQILALAFAAEGKPVRIRHLPTSMVRVAVALAAHLTPERVYGPVQFLAAVLSRDMTAPAAGHDHLADHFAELAACPRV